MPKEKSPGKATTRRYTDIEKEPSVKLCRQLAADVGDGLAGPDAQRVRDLEAENKEMSQELGELRGANDILRKASAFFAAELDRPHK
jgi:hypothetical protein